MSLNIKLYVLLPSFMYKMEPADASFMDAVASQAPNHDPAPPEWLNIWHPGLSEHSFFASFTFRELICVLGEQYSSTFGTYLPSPVNHTILNF